MSEVFGNSGVSGPDWFTVPEVAGEKGLRSVCFTFLSRQ